MIEFERVRKAYPQGRRTVVALDDVTLRIEPGEIAVVMGRSGSGKSTLLHLAGALDLPTSGVVRVEGRDVAQLTDDERTLLRRDRIGFVFQYFNLVPTLSVADNVALPCLLAGDRPARVAPRVDALLERIGLRDRASHFPEELSGGEMQRVAIARALVGEPPIVLADEPTGNLDSATAGEILGLLREVGAEKGRTVVIVTHDASAERFGTRTIRLRDGRLDGTAA